MLFNTLQFAGFFIVVYGLYLVLEHKWQNRMLLVASYIFYGAWDWMFLSLIWISTILDYYCGLSIHRATEAKKRKLFLFLSVFGNLSILGLFKYFNFFASNLQQLLEIFGLSLNYQFLHIVLPVGISFYTFQTMSYTIDIYKRKMEPTDRFFDFALFVAFFPQLVAGPIERAKRLLPQIINPRKVTLDGFYQGCYLIFWGLFLKVFVGDNLGVFVQAVFSANAPYEGMRVWFGLYAFAFQIFADFAGYSKIARGLGKCMGFDIMLNFNLPYFSTNPREFWRRWHISLSSWLRDYLYIPLGGNRVSTLKKFRNVFLTMLLGGLWHGASWTFVIWGAYQGMLLTMHGLGQQFIKSSRLDENNFLGKMWFVVKVLFFFHLTCLGWLFFRAESIEQIFNMLNALFFNLRIQKQYFVEYGNFLIFYIWPLILVQFMQFKKNDEMAMYKSNVFIKALFYFICIILFITYGVSGGHQFIYFQF